MCAMSNDPLPVSQSFMTVCRKACDSCRELARVLRVIARVNRRPGGSATRSANILRQLSSHQSRFLHFGRPAQSSEMTSDAARERGKSQKTGGCGWRPWRTTRASRGAAFSNTTRSPTMLFPVLKHSPTLSSVFRHSHILSSVNTHNTSHDVHCLCR